MIGVPIGGSSPRETMARQESLLDFGDDAVPGALRPERVPLSRGAWIDVQRGWLSGSAALFGRLVRISLVQSERDTNAPLEKFRHRTTVLILL